MLVRANQVIKTSYKIILVRDTPTMYAPSTHYLPTVYPLCTHYLPIVYSPSTYHLPFILATSMEHPPNIHGTSMEHPWNIHGTSTEHPWNVHPPPCLKRSCYKVETCWIVFKMFENVHNVPKRSQCSKMFKNGGKWSNVVKCGPGVTYPLTSAFEDRNIELLHPNSSLEQEWLGELLIMM